ncbi:transient receptor potential cation channel subfamily V member 5-like [Watersipora subatra]|uniref:transient receptor potential cation channel subfamily V member 5-like n=1 Tax=Watersipora subatra TaxID=2589382 RepID=UPI00355B47B6
MSSVAKESRPLETCSGAASSFIFNIIPFTSGGLFWKFNPNLLFAGQEEQTNPVYSLLNNHKTGSLIELHDEKKIEELKEQCEKGICKYLYHEGSNTGIIEEKEYERWLELMGTEMTFPEHRKSSEKVASGKGLNETKDLTIQFVEHEACWNLFHRGAMGETLLHLCYLNNTEKHLEIAQILLEKYPKLCLDIYEAEEYYGESALHFAIVHKDLDSVKLLIEKGAKIDQRATGRFFLPDDQKTTPPKKTTNYEGEAYYGEYPLAFAACLGYETIYDYLLGKGADPNQPDSFGNTVLHMMVIKNKPAMYSYVARHPIKKGKHEIRNYSLAGLADKDTTNGLTPLALANRLGRQQVFNEILELRKKELWRFSNVTCSVYPVREVDTIGPDGSMDWSSSLMITLNGGTDDHVDMLQSGVLRQLLDDKWKYFVKKRFFQRLAVVLAHIIFMTIAVSLRPRGPKMLNNLAMYCARTTFEILTMLTCGAGIGMQVQEVISLGFLFSVTDLRNAPFKALYLFGCCLQLLLIPVRIAYLTSSNLVDVERLQFTEEIILGISLPITWMMVLFFAKVTILCGPLINLVFIYITKDLLPFLVIVAVVFIAFALSFHNMFKTIINDDVQTFYTVFGSLMALFQFTLGEFEYDEFKKTSTPWLTMIVFVIFMLMMPILLLNMLIAMMSSTFYEVIKKSEKDWILQWAKIVIALESTFNKKDLLKYQEMYSIQIKTSLPFLHVFYTVRGVMVIKTTNKTKAKQKKDALRNWKRTTREILDIIEEIKKQTAGKIEINSETVFPSVIDELSEARQLGRRKSSNRRISVDLATAVEQLADSLAVKASPQLTPRNAV